MSFLTGLLVVPLVWIPRTRHQVLRMRTVLAHRPPPGLGATLGRRRICSLPHMIEEKAAVDRLIDDLGSLVARHASAPLELGELHRSLSDATETAQAALDASAAAASAPANKVTVADLRAQLAARGLPTSGLKADLVARLAAADELAVGNEVHAGSSSTAAASASAVDEALELQLRRVRQKHAGQGPQTGVFTDGGCSPNPGPGGWGVVAVRDGVELWRAGAHEPSTTNNRMEMAAIIHAMRELPADEAHVIYSDSQLCVRTLNEWAASWARNGWKQGSGATPKNLDLVQEAHALKQARPLLSLEWIKGHGGSLWNEYADCLASAWMSRG